jgi:hypothetical protein
MLIYTAPSQSHAPEDVFLNPIPPRSSSSSSALAGIESNSNTIPSYLSLLCAMKVDLVLRLRSLRRPSWCIMRYVCAQWSESKSTRGKEGGKKLE